MKVKTLTPTPGSVEAKQLGCTCAVLDNHYGRGFRIAKDKPPMFYVSGDCPVHCDLDAQDDETEDA